MSSIIFVGSSSSEKNYSNTSLKKYVSSSDILFRIITSFIPPLTKKYSQVHIDLQGPLIAIIFLIGFLNYGYSFKSTTICVSPTEVVLLFAFLMPLICFVLMKFGNSSVNLFEIVSLIGYSIYGHIFTLLFSFLCFHEQSNFFFFVCLIIFGGLSTLRVVLVLLGTIPLPAARFLICTFISVINILYLIFLHFAYMHKTFVYKSS